MVTARISTVRGTTLPHFQGHEPGGNLSTLMHPDGAEVSYTRDAAGRISAIHWTAPGEAPQPIVTGVSWQPFGGISSFTYGDGSTQTRSYDRSGRLTQLTSGSVLHRTYGWDATDNITAITDLIDPARSQMFGYDALYRLTFAQGIYGSHSYQYDALGNRTALNTDTASTSYAYAAASNRLIEVDEGTGAVAIAYDPAGNTLDDGERSFSYNARNRLSEADGHEYGHNAHNLRVFKPRFGLAGDASGDGLITEADLTLLQQALNGQGTATQSMDCNQDGVVDNRDTPCIARQIGANRNQGQGQGNGGGQGNGNGNGNGNGGGGQPPAPTTEPVQVGWVLFTHDEQGRLIGEYDEQGNPLRRYIWLNDLPVALIDAAGIHYIHADHLNTPQAVTDSLGTLVWAADYAPFGEVTETIATLELNLRFPGQYFDRETGLHQNWHREYDPMTGRYTQSDPIGLSGGFNAYLYAGATPITAFDPNGQQVVDPYSERHIQRNRNNRCPLTEPSPFDCEGNRWSRDLVSVYLLNYHGGWRGYSTYRRPDPSNPWAGFQCTYDRAGRVVTDSPLQGTYDYVSPDVSVGGHRSHDVIPHDINEDYESPDLTEIYCTELICRAED